MKLQILVPQYNEPDEMVKTLLDSIASQQNINMNEVGVIICNDGSDTLLSDNLIKSYPFNIEYYKEGHRGPSAARNTCLKHAVSDYITYIDADDIYYDKTGLYRIFQEMEVGFDSLFSPFMEECKLANGKLIYKQMDKCTAHPLGKFFNRTFIVENNILWNEDLLVHEDAYYNILAMALSNVCKYYDYPFCLWRHRVGSITRSDPMFSFKNFKNVIDSGEALINELEKRKLFNKIDFYFESVVFETYYKLNTSKWKNPEVKQYLEETEKHFYMFFEKHKHYWKNAINKEQISEFMQQYIVKEDFSKNKTIDQWLEYIKMKYS